MTGHDVIWADRRGSTWVDYPGIGGHRDTRLRGDRRIVRVEHAFEHGRPSAAESEYVEPDPQVLNDFVAPEGFTAVRDALACLEPRGSLAATPRSCHGRR